MSGATKSEVDTLIVCSCDENYFPLVKGLVLSILDKGPLPASVGIAFIDIGCDAASTRWLLARGVRILRPDPHILGHLADPALGYQRSQTCRPLLPKLFPEAATLIWIDCDTWVQDASIFSYLTESVRANKDKLFIAPECHFSYTAVNEDYHGRHREMFSYYEPIFGADIAAQMCVRQTLNSGVFAMAVDNPIWTQWEREVSRIYLNGGSDYSPATRHMAEQIALNVTAHRSSGIILLDPLYNYLCLWNPPFRDAQGVVRVSLPPHLPVGIVHLAGGWNGFGATYFGRGLLYQGGNYLTGADRTTLFRERMALNYR